jgi:sporulation-control protein spo0M
MGILDNIKAAAGVGSATLEVDLKQRPTQRGGELVALLRVIPGKNKQKMRYLTAEVNWEGTWSFKNAEGLDIKVDGKAYLYKVKQPGADDVMLEPGKTMEFPWTVRIPMDAPLSAKDCTYNIYVRADIDDAKDPEFRATLDIK